LNPVDFRSKPRVGEHSVQSTQRVFHIAEDRQFHDLVLVDLRVVDVDVDDRAMFRKLADLAGHAIVEAHADGEQQVGLVDALFA
jgi:hypothetical protein